MWWTNSIENLHLRVMLRDIKVFISLIHVMGESMRLAII